ncbi:hypothetical protein AVEN_29411-1 [Araneus ventricosus]|uniref:Uncharacterized protein n=1 Tax=Araneus ventricosus TaxID=182803 RepID=A0A4Y2D0Q8_ARAVE|nr:hypothetical protein AVEN_29411-1 [Araneus ventricosus]
MGNARGYIQPAHIGLPIVSYKVYSSRTLMAWIAGADYKFVFVNVSVYGSSCESKCQEIISTCIVEDDCLMTVMGKSCIVMSSPMMHSDFQVVYYGPMVKRIYCLESKSVNTGIPKLA